MSLAAKVSILINLLFQLHIFHFFYFLFYFLRLLCAVFKDSLTFKNWRFTLFESAKLPISRVDGKQNVSVQFLTFPPTTLNFQGKRGEKRKSPGAFKAIGVMRRRKRGRQSRVLSVCRAGWRVCVCHRRAKWKCSGCVSGALEKWDVQKRNQIILEK